MANVDDPTEDRVEYDESVFVGRTFGRRSDEGSRRSVLSVGDYWTGYALSMTVRLVHSLRCRGERG